jgi:hypothetical protein
MDQRERANDREEAFRAFLDGRQAAIWTALPALVVSYDAERQTIEAKPTIEAQYRGPDGATRFVSMPVLLDCPVVWQSGGEAVLTFPIATGDDCLIVFASRCIDAWWQSGSIQPPAEFRMHDLSDGFAFVGPRALPKALQNVSTTTAQLRSKDGTTYVELDPVGQIVTVKAPGGIVLDGPVHAKSTVLVDGNATFNGGSVQHAGKEIGKTHTHTDPQGGNTGIVN